MKLVLHQNFYDFFNEHRYNAEDAHLMYRMQAFDKQSVSSFRVSLCHNVVLQNPCDTVLDLRTQCLPYIEDSELSAFLI